MAFITKKLIFGFQILDLKVHFLAYIKGNTYSRYFIIQINYQLNV